MEIDPAVFQTVYFDLLADSMLYPTGHMYWSNIGVYQTEHILPWGCWSLCCREGAR